jgi:hypothetical protein
MGQRRALRTSRAIGLPLVLGLAVWSLSPAGTVSAGPSATPAASSAPTLATSFALPSRACGAMLDEFVISIRATGISCSVGRFVVRRASRDPGPWVNGAGPRKVAGMKCSGKILPDYNRYRCVGMGGKVVWRYAPPI